MSDLVRDLTGLVRGEGRLIKTEIVEGAKTMAAGVEMIAVGLVFLLVATFVLVQALVIALAEWVGAGWASLIVGALLALIGAVLVLRGRKHLSTSELIPERTIEQTGRDIQLAKEQI